MRLSSQIVLLLTIALQPHFSVGALLSVTLPEIATKPSNEAHRLPHETPSVLKDKTVSLHVKPSQGLPSSPFSSSPCSSKEETTAEPGLNNRDCSGSEKTESTIMRGGFLAIILCVVVLVTAMHFKVVNQMQEMTCVQATATRARSVVLAARRVTQKVLQGIFRSHRHQEQGLDDGPTRLSEVKLTLPLVKSERDELSTHTDVS